MSRSENWDELHRLKAVEIEIRRFVTEIRGLADEIENLARLWTRSGDEFVRKMAEQLGYRVELLRRLGDDMQDIARRM